jgi:hypothetical protein
VGKEALVLRQIALVALSAIVSTVAVAQEVQQTEPAWRVINREGVAVRCGPDPVFYAVAEYGTGRLLLVDGTAGAHARVRYPDDLGVMVPADEVRAVNDQVVELVRASSLRAPSALNGITGSWKGVYESDLPAGTRLTVRETIQGDRGQVLGYRVAAPMPPVAAGHAWAFVPADALRDATPAEIEAHLKTSQPATPTTTQPQVQPTRPANPATTPATTPAEQPGQPTTPADSEPVSSETPAEPTAQPGDITAIPGEPVRTETTPAETPTQIRASKLEDLEASLEASRRLPPAQLDEALEELLAEYGRTRTETTDDERLAAQLDMRIEWLKLRIATRDQRRSIEAALNSATDRSRQLDRQVAEWRQGRAYALVGRLVVSTVYNGERLPRMYRVQSVSPVDGATRTLGYVTPNAEVEAKLGRVVGVVGEPRFDPQLRLVIIRPDQIDVMPE